MGSTHSHEMEELRQQIEAMRQETARKAAEERSMTERLLRILENQGHSSTHAPSPEHNAHSGTFVMKATQPPIFSGRKEDVFFFRKAFRNWCSMHSCLTPLLADTRVEVSSAEHSTSNGEIVLANRAYQGLLQSVEKCKPLYNAMILNGSPSGSWGILTTWFDSTDEGKKFRVRREFEKLAMGDRETPNEYLCRAYVIAKQMKEAGVDWPDAEINRQIARSLSSAFSIEKRFLALQENLSRTDLEKAVRGASLEAELEKGSQDNGGNGHALTAAAASGGGRGFNRGGQ